MLYTVESSLNTDEPIMLLNKHVGFDAEDGQGIDGAVFQRELLNLDGLGKKRIQVWINSPGGNVMEGYNIYNAILKSSTPVDTYCVGIAASIAGVIFMAGRKRIMADYGCLMMHNPFDPSGTTNSAAMSAMKDSLCQMLCAKCNLSNDDVNYMMTVTSWLDADACLNKGFCTEIEATADVNRKWMREVTDAKAYYKLSTEIVNNIFKSNSQSIMLKKVANLLRLHEEASEDAITNAVNSLMLQSNEYKTKLETVQNKLAAEELKSTELSTKLSDANNKISAFEAAELQAKKDAALEMVTNFAKVGRIKNEASTIAKWAKLAEADFDGTKNMIEELPINKVAPDVTNVENKVEVAGGYNAALIMANIQNKTKI